MDERVILNAEGQVRLAQLKEEIERLKAAEAAVPSDYPPQPDLPDHLQLPDHRQEEWQRNNEIRERAVESVQAAFRDWRKTLERRVRRLIETGSEWSAEEQAYMDETLTEVYELFDRFAPQLSIGWSQLRTEERVRRTAQALREVELAMLQDGPTPFHAMNHARLSVELRFLTHLRDFGILEATTPSSARNTKADRPAQVRRVQEALKKFKRNNGGFYPGQSDTGKPFGGKITALYRFVGTESGATYAPADRGLGTGRKILNAMGWLKPDENNMRPTLEEVLGKLEAYKG